jgi:hypothetical protein
MLDRLNSENTASQRKQLRAELLDRANGGNLEKSARPDRRLRHLAVAAIVIRPVNCPDQHPFARKQCEKFEAGDSNSYGNRLRVWSGTQSITLAAGL